MRLCIRITVLQASQAASKPEALDDCPSSPEANPNFSAVQIRVAMIFTESPLLHNNNTHQRALNNEVSAYQIES